MKDFKKASKQAAEKIKNMTPEELKESREQFFKRLREESTQNKGGDLIDRFRVISINGRFREEGK